MQTIAAINLVKIVIDVRAIFLGLVVPKLSGQPQVQLNNLTRTCQILCMDLPESYTIYRIADRMLATRCSAAMWLAETVVPA